MISVADLQAQCRTEAREQFAQRHPWFIHRLVQPVIGLIPFQTRFAGAGGGIPTDSLWRSQLLLEPTSFTLLPVVKGDKNPWEKGILVGRAPNCDVVLRDPSVSKNHAVLTQTPEGGWMLETRKSLNPTLVDGQRIGEGAGIRLVNGTHVQFGNVECEFVESAQLYDALARQAA